MKSWLLAPLGFAQMQTRAAWERQTVCAVRGQEPEAICVPHKGVQAPGWPPPEGDTRGEVLTSQTHPAVPPQHEAVAGL